MKIRCLSDCMRVFSYLGLVFFASHCQAQSRGGNVTVQLPTFHQFGVSTTVVVPDRGGLYLGGVGSSSTERSGFRRSFLPGIGSRGVGRTSSAGGISVHATIIDHNEIDRALLAEAARRRGARFDIHGRPVETPKLPRDLVGRRWAAGRDKKRTTTRLPAQAFTP